MRICVAQSRSVKGNIKINIKKHLRLIKYALFEKVDIIIFPELSLTNYEPQIAKDFVSDQWGSKLSEVQKISDTDNILIGVGIPTKSNRGLHISMLIIQPDKPQLTYSKQILHSDEYPYFVSGKEQIILEVQNVKLSPAICYESLQEDHLKNALKLGAEIYIASTTMPKKGTLKALDHYSNMAKKYKIPVLMSNSIGPCDDFESVGQSSVWDEHGNLIGQLDSENEGILIYNTSTEEVTKKQIKIA